MGAQDDTVGRFICTHMSGLAKFPHEYNILYLSNCLFQSILLPIDGVIANTIARDQSGRFILAAVLTGLSNEGCFGLEGHDTYF